MEVPPETLWRLQGQTFDGRNGGQMFLVSVRPKLPMVSWPKVEFNLMLRIDAYCRVKRRSLSRAESRDNPGVKVSGVLCLLASSSTIVQCPD